MWRIDFFPRSVYNATEVKQHTLSFTVSDRSEIAGMVDQNEGVTSEWCMPLYIASDVSNWHLVVRSTPSPRSRPIIKPVSMSVRPYVRPYVYVR